jgi:hypothetical protein
MRPGRMPAGTASHGARNQGGESRHEKPPALWKPRGVRWSYVRVLDDAEFPGRVECPQLPVARGRVGITGLVRRISAEQVPRLAAGDDVLRGLAGGSRTLRLPRLVQGRCFGATGTGGLARCGLCFAYRDCLGRADLLRIHERLKRGEQFLRIGGLASHCGSFPPGFAGIVSRRIAGDWSVLWGSMV